MTSLATPPAAVKPARKARPKPPRSCGIGPAHPSGRRLLTLNVGKETSLYWLLPVPADYGTGYELEKFSDGSRYHVNLDLAAGCGACECLGHLRHGHRTLCKHVAALLRLHAEGRLAAPAA